MKKDQSPYSPSLFTCKDTKFSTPGVLLIKSKGIVYKVLYDPADFVLICPYRWNIHSKGYVVSTINGKTILMHRLIMGIDDPEIQVDHKFHNKLDNRRAKIRICTPSENRRNSQKHKEAHSKFKGVYRDGRFWHVQIMFNGKVVNLGRYRSEITAAKVYDVAARLFFRDFAFLNFPDFFEVKQLAIPGLL